jgi:2-amino-4-hydroxy-6-hydroxymethyldihydropteridine diphosphokinase
VSLGANLGDAQQALSQALAALGQLPGTAVVGASSFYKTAPVDAEGPDYINAVALLHSALGPLELLHTLQALEQAQGRERPFRHAPRTLDLDLIWFGGACRASTELTLPHPRWQARAFVIEPLAEVLAQVSAQVSAQVAAQPDGPEDDAPGLSFAPLAALMPPLEARQNLAANQGIAKII